MRVIKGWGGVVCNLRGRVGAIAEKLVDLVVESGDLGDKVAHFGAKAVIVRDERLVL